MAFQWIVILLIGWPPLVGFYSLYNLCSFHNPYISYISYIFFVPCVFCPSSLCNSYNAAVIIYNALVIRSRGFLVFYFLSNTTCWLSFTAITPFFCRCCLLTFFLFVFFIIAVCRSSSWLRKIKPSNTCFLAERITFPTFFCYNIDKGVPFSSSRNNLSVCF